MPLIERSTFIPHPEGVFIGTLVDVTFDPEGMFGPRIVWAFDTDEEMEDGRPFRISYKTSPKLNEKSNLYALLQAFGENPDGPEWDKIEEVGEFHPLKGREVQLQIVHKKNGDRTFSNIETVMQVPRRRGRQEPPREERQPVGAAAGSSSAKWDEKD